MESPVASSAADVQAVLAARNAWREATAAFQIYIRAIEQGTKTLDGEYEVLCQDVREKGHIYRQLCCLPDVAV